jgi:hypothetical protein
MRNASHIDAPKCTHIRGMHADAYAEMLREENTVRSLKITAEVVQGDRAAS